MSNTETIFTSKSVATELTNAYHSILEKARKELPKIDPELVVNLLIYETKYPEKAPLVRFEIVCKPSVEPNVKKAELFEKTGRCAEIRHGHVFVLDHYLTLRNFEEIARDEAIEYISGDVLLR
jgi:hypothetical protein